MTGAALAASGHAAVRFTGAPVAVLVAAGVTASLWALLFTVRWIATLAKLPDADAPTMELGLESPALANLLINRWQLTRSAIAATLVDLAARRHVELTEVSADQFLVRTRTTVRVDPLTGYEQQLLDLVQERAGSQPAPIDVLDLGSEEQAAGWWKRFTRSVEADARQQDLARSRWEAFDWVLVGGSAGIPLLLAAFGLGLAHVFEKTTSTGRTTGRWDGFWYVVIAWAGVFGAMAALRAIRDTPRGRRACARWLGVRQYLRDDSELGDAPPPAVAIWDRLLAYGVALGAAPVTTNALPFGAEDPYRAWSHVGGTWHEVRIEYPRRFGYGKGPVLVLSGGLVRLAFGLVMGVQVLPAVVRALWDAVNKDLGGGFTGKEQALLVGFEVLFGLVGLGLVGLVATALVRIGRAVRDLGRAVTLEGQVVRLRTGSTDDKTRGGYVAVDDGTDESIRAWRLPGARSGLGGSTSPAHPLPVLHRGTRVRVRVHAHVGHIVDVQDLGVTAPPLPTRPVEPATSTILTSTPGGLAGLDAADVQGAVGIALPEVAPSTVPGALAVPAAPARPVRTFADGAGHSVMATVMGTGEAPGRALLSVAGRLGLGHRHQVEGLGDAAWWMHDEVLVVSHEGSLLFLQVRLPDRPPDQRLAAARTLAQRMLQ